MDKLFILKEQWQREGPKQGINWLIKGGKLTIQGKELNNKINT